MRVACCIARSTAQKKTKKEDRATKKGERVIQDLPSSYSSAGRLLFEGVYT